MKNKSNFSIPVLCIVMGFLLHNSIETFAAPTTTIGSILKLEENHLQKNSENVLQNQDEDVIELENLKHTPTVNEGKNVETLPELQEQLEAISKGGDFEQTHHHHPTAHQIMEHNLDKAEDKEVEPEPEIEVTPAPVTPQPTHHLTHHLPNHLHNSKNLEQAPTEVHVEAEKEEAKATAKTFPGAARLTYGTHLETDVHNVETTMSPPMEETSAESENAGSVITHNGQRRSHNELLRKPMKYENAETLLRHSGGQYSAFDMAQYVFWTGDEAGVANAIEEFIQEGLMSRENAIKFLRDIQLGIEYLQSTYANPHASQGMSDEPAMHHKSLSTLQPIPEKVAPLKATLSPEVIRALEKLPSLLKLHETNERKVDENAIDYDEMAGRLRLADFLYAEYSLEEVIYQLAKVMFTQSLTKGSETAQTALQRLTGFLESEGVHGRISPGLQKKVLDVLLAALSDTLAENPELLTAARIALGGSMKKISSQSKM